MPSDAVDFLLAAQLSTAVDVRAGIDEALRAVLDEVDGRAIGLWQVDGNHLRMLGFAAVADMPAEVARAFRESTSTISTRLTRFGICKAASLGEPVLMRIEDDDGSLTGSPGWLVRFDSASSISIPVHAGAKPIAVLAVSSRESLTTESGTGARMIAFARALDLAPA